jgi:outer membrane protein assembly factor BamB
MMRPVRIAASMVAVCALGIACGAIDIYAGNDDWRGFRGQERQGAGRAADAPLHWSAANHVRWKTAIPGTGHSSPVIAGDLVLVTTAYEAPGARQALQYARRARLALALAAFAIFLILPPPAARWQDAAAAVAMAAIVALAVADALTLQVMQSPARARLAAAMAGLAGLTLAAYGLRDRAPGRHLLALTLASIAIAAVAGMPNLAHQTSPIIVALIVLVAAAAAAATLLWRGLFARLSDLPSATRLSVAAGILILAFSAAAVLGSAIAAFVGAAAVAGIAARSRFGARVEWLRPWRVLVLAATALAWLTPTILVPRSGWVHAIAAVERETGQLRWIREGLLAPRVAVHRANSMATPTAVTGDDRVVAYFGGPGLMAVGMSGQLLWTNRDVPFQSLYGVGASPTLASDSVLISSLTADGPYLAAFDAATGRERWRTARAPVHPEFGDSRTPLVMTIQGRPTVVVWGIDELAGHDMADGRVLWKYAHGANARMGSMVASLVGNGDLLYLPLENGMLALDTTRLAAGEDPVTWTSRGGASALATPVLYDKRLYAVSAAGVATCTDAATGELLWRSRLTGEYRSSPIAVADRVYFTDQTGKTTVVKAGPAYEVVAENHIGEPVAATLAPVDGDLYIRGERHLFRVSR